MKTCKFCNKDISNLAGQARYCDRKCAKDAEYARTFYEINCKTCGKLEKVKRKTSIYCKLCIPKTEKNPNVSLNCKHCKVEFEVRYQKRDREFCSKSCSTTYMNEHRDIDSIKEKLSIKAKERYENGFIHPWTGRKHSQESISKMSENAKIRLIGEGNPMFGKNHTTETREKISKTRSDKIINGEYAGWFSKGKIFSKKANKELHFRSSWEKAVLEYFDNMEDVAEIKVEPIRISYYDGIYKRYYIPDIIIVFKDVCNPLLIEIKPEFFTKNDINISKHKAAREYCKQNNMTFEIWTEKTIKERINLTPKQMFDML